MYTKKLIKACKQGLHSLTVHTNAWEHHSYKWVTSSSESLRIAFKDLIAKIFKHQMDDLLFECVSFRLPLYAFFYFKIPRKKKGFQFGRCCQ